MFNTVANAVVWVAKVAIAYTVSMVIATIAGRLHRRRVNKNVVVLDA